MFLDKDGGMPRGSDTVQVNTEKTDTEVGPPSLGQKRDKESHRREGDVFVQGG